MGPGEAKMYLNRGMWSTQFIQETTTRTVALKPKLGEAQTMSFSPVAPPSFYACDARISDVIRRRSRDKRTKCPPRSRALRDLYNQVFFCGRRNWRST